MSGRRSKKGQRLGSSRRNPRGLISQAEERADENDLPRTVTEGGGTEEVDPCPSLSSPLPHSTSADVVAVVETPEKGQHVSAEDPLFLQPQNIAHPSAAGVKKRRVGSTRKNISWSKPEKEEDEMHTEHLDHADRISEEREGSERGDHMFLRSVDRLTELAVQTGDTGAVYSQCEKPIDISVPQTFRYVEPAQGPEQSMLASLQTETVSLNPDDQIEGAVPCENAPSTTSPPRDANNPLIDKCQSEDFSAYGAEDQVNPSSRRNIESTHQILGENSGEIEIILQREDADKTEDKNATLGERNGLEEFRVVTETDESARVRQGEQDGAMEGSGSTCPMLSSSLSNQSQMVVTDEKRYEESNDQPQGSEWMTVEEVQTEFTLGTGTDCPSQVSETKRASTEAVSHHHVPQADVAVEAAETAGTRGEDLTSFCVLHPEADETEPSADQSKVSAKCQSDVEMHPVHNTPGKRRKMGSTRRALKGRDDNGKTSYLSEMDSAKEKMTDIIVKEDNAQSEDGCNEEETMPKLFLETQNRTYKETKTMNQEETATPEEHPTDQQGYAGTHESLCEYSVQAPSTSHQLLLSQMHTVTDVASSYSGEELLADGEQFRREKDRIDSSNQSEKNPDTTELCPEMDDRTKGGLLDDREGCGELREDLPIMGSGEAETEISFDVKDIVTDELDSYCSITGSTLTEHCIDKASVDGKDGTDLFENTTDQENIPETGMVLVVSATSNELQNFANTFQIQSNPSQDDTTSYLTLEQQGVSVNVAGLPTGSDYVMSGDQHAEVAEIESLSHPSESIELMEDPQFKVRDPEAPVSGKVMDPDSDPDSDSAEQTKLSGLEQSNADGNLTQECTDLNRGFVEGSFMVASLVGPQIDPGEAADECSEKTVAEREDQEQNMLKMVEEAESVMLEEVQHLASNASETDGTQCNASLTPIEKLETIETLIEQSKTTPQSVELTADIVTEFGLAEKTDTSVSTEDDTQLSTKESSSCGDTRGVSEKVLNKTKDLRYDEDLALGEEMQSNLISSDVSPVHNNPPQSDNKSNQQTASPQSIQSTEKDYDHVSAESQHMEMTEVGERVFNELDYQDEGDKGGSTKELDMRSGLKPESISESGHLKDYIDTAKIVEVNEDSRLTDIAAGGEDEEYKGNSLKQAYIYKDRHGESSHEELQVGSAVVGELHHPSFSSQTEMSQAQHDNSTSLPAEETRTPPCVACSTNIVTEPDLVAIERQNQEHSNTSSGNGEITIVMAGTLSQERESEPLSISSGHRRKMGSSRRTQRGYRAEKKSDDQEKDKEKKSVKIVADVERALKREETCAMGDNEVTMSLATKLNDPSQENCPENTGRDTCHRGSQNELEQASSSPYHPNVASVSEPSDCSSEPHDILEYKTDVDDAVQEDNKEEAKIQSHETTRTEPSDLTSHTHSASQPQVTGVLHDTVQKDGSVPFDQFVQPDGQPQLKSENGTQKKRKFGSSRRGLRGHYPEGKAEENELADDGDQDSVREIQEVRRNDEEFLFKNATDLQTVQGIASCNMECTLLSDEGDVNTLDRGCVQELTDDVSQTGDRLDVVLLSDTDQVASHLDAQVRQTNSKSNSEDTSHELLMNRREQRMDREDVEAVHCDDRETGKQEKTDGNDEVMREDIEGGFTSTDISGDFTHYSVKALPHQSSQHEKCSGGTGSKSHSDNSTLVKEADILTVQPCQAQSPVADNSFQDPTVSVTANKEHTAHNEHPLPHSITTDKKRKFGSTRRNLMGRPRDSNKEEILNQQKEEVRECGEDVKAEVGSTKEENAVLIQKLHDCSLSVRDGPQETSEEMTPPHGLNQSEGVPQSEMTRDQFHIDSGQDPSTDALSQLASGHLPTASGNSLNAPTDTKLQTKQCEITCMPQNQPMPQTSQGEDGRAHVESINAGRRRVMGSTRKNIKEEQTRKMKNERWGSEEGAGGAVRQEPPQPQRDPVFLETPTGQNKEDSQEPIKSPVVLQPDPLRSPQASRRKMGSRRTGKGYHRMVGQQAEKPEDEGGDRNPFGEACQNPGEDIQDKVLQGQTIQVPNSSFSSQQEKPETAPMLRMSHEHASVAESSGIKGNKEPLPEGKDRPLMERAGAGPVPLDQIQNQKLGQSTSQRHRRGFQGGSGAESSTSGLVQRNVLMVGNSDVGKTSFIQRLQTGTFRQDHSATIGVDTYTQTVTVGDRGVELQIWDTAGQERFHSITKQVFHKAQGILLMYDITSAESFCAVRDWIACAQERAPDDVIMMLIGNKNDSVERQVQHQEAESLAKEYSICFMECSAATGANVPQVVEAMSSWLLQRSPQTEEAGMELHRDPAPPQRKTGCC